MKALIWQIIALVLFPSSLHFEFGFCGACTISRKNLIAECKCIVYVFAAHPIRRRRHFVFDLFVHLCMHAYVCVYMLAQAEAFFDLLGIKYCLLLLFYFFAK